MSTVERAVPCGHEVFDTAQAGGADPYDSESTVRSWGSGVTGL